MKSFGTRIFALVVLMATCCIGAHAQRTNWEKLLHDLNSNSKSSGRELVVTLREPGELAKKLTPQDCERVTFLRVNGPMDRNDLKLLTELAKRKETINREGKTVQARIDLDLQNARIVEPGTFRPKEITVMPDVFRSCVGLRSIILPNNITDIAAGAFSSCSNLEYVYIPDYVRGIGNKAFEYNSKLNNIDMPNGVEYIGEFAFSRCYALKDIRLPLGLVTIGKGAFSSSGLRHAEIPDRVETIGRNAFDATSFKEFVVSPGNAKYCSIDGVLFNKEGDNLESCPAGKTGKYIIPEGTKFVYAQAFQNSCLSEVVFPTSCKSIGEAAFNYSKVEVVVLPEGLTAIRANLFEECGELQEVKIPSTLTEISKEAFRGCRKLGNVELPEGLTTIGDEAFRACKSFTEIVIPASVKRIGEKAFYYCVKATAIKMKGAVPPTAIKPSNENKKVTLIVPVGSLNAYSSASGWKDIKKIEECE